jgi:hypothetical protein
LCFWTLSLLFLFKTQHFGDWILPPSSDGTYLVGSNWQLVSISGHQHQHNIGCINQAQHKPSARVKANIKNGKTLHTHEAYHLCPWTISRPLLKSECYQNRSHHSLYGTNIETQFSHIMYTGQGCSFLTSDVIMGAQMGEMSKLGWLIRWSTGDMWVDSLYFL